MNKQKLNDEQKANSEKIQIYFENQIDVHITLNKTTLLGHHYWFNGKITKLYSSTLFELTDRLTYEKYIFSVFQLQDDGINEYQKEEFKK